MVEFVKEHLSNRELERAILKEAGGCNYEDEKNKIYDISTDVILHANALAKKLHKLWGIYIGNDPRKRKLTRPVDFAAARAAIPVDHPDRRAHLAQLEQEEEEYLRAQAAVDIDAWDTIIDTEDRIMRRALQLQAIGLVVCNVDYLVPDAVAEREASLGESGRVPLEGTIQLTDAGKAFLASGKTLRKKKGTRSSDPRDEEIEIAGSKR